MLVQSYRGKREYLPGCVPRWRGTAEYGTLPGWCTQSLQVESAAAHFAPRIARRQTTRRNVLYPVANENESILSSHYAPTPSVESLRVPPHCLRRIPQSALLRRNG